MSVRRLAEMRKGGDGGMIKRSDLSNASPKRREIVLDISAPLKEKRNLHSAVQAARLPRKTRVGTPERLHRKDLSALVGK